MDAFQHQFRPSESVFALLTIQLVEKRRVELSELTSPCGGHRLARFAKAFPEIVELLETSLGKKSMNRTTPRTTILLLRSRIDEPGGNGKTTMVTDRSVSAARPSGLSGSRDQHQAPPIALAGTSHVPW